MRKLYSFIMVLVVCIGLMIAGSSAFAAGTVMGFLQSSYNLIAGDSVTLNLTSASAAATQWIVNDELAPGAVTIKSSSTKAATLQTNCAGRVIVTAKSQDGTEASCLLVIAPTKITLSATETTVGISKERSISVTSDRRVSCSTIDPNVALTTINYTSGYSGTNNTYGTITIVGVNPGSTEIVVSDAYGTSAVCSVTVLDSYLELDQKKVSIDLSYAHCNPDVSEYDSEYYHTDVRVLYGDVVSVSSSNKAVATGTFVDKNYPYYPFIGIIGKKPGSAVLTVTGSDGYEAKLNVTVSSPFKLSRSSLTLKASSWNWLDDYCYDDYCGTIYTTEGEITSVKSLNTNIVQIIRGFDDYEGEWLVIPQSVGNAKIECADRYGQKRTCTITVDKSCISAVIEHFSRSYAVKYGSITVNGYTLAGAKVTATVAGKNYSANVDRYGDFTVKIPVKKIGTNIKCTFKYHGGVYSETIKIKKPSTTVSLARMYRSTKKASITVKNAHKGDVVSLKIGKKTYKKTLKKNYSKYKFKIKLKKKAKAGSKVTVQVKNKFKQKLASKSVKVYYASKLKVGMKKSQVRLVPGYEKPDDIWGNGNYTTWEYDNKDRFLYFYKGRLSSWEEIKDYPD